MKKVFLTIVMSMFMSMGFAQDGFNFNIRRLAERLELNQEQYERFEYVNDNMIREINEANELGGIEKFVNVRDAIRKDVHGMRYILTAEQFRDYVILLFVTVRNNIYNEINL